jgi:hypothetical protein
MQPLSFANIEIVETLIEKYYSNDFVIVKLFGLISDSSI